GLFFTGVINMKPFNSYNIQIRKLQARGIKIKSKTKVKKILIEENYYSLINGYKDLFLDNNKYKVGTDFFEIYALYNFDRNLRNILLKKILKIENKLKSVLAYTFSKSYGNDYLNIQNYDIIFKDNHKYSTLNKKSKKENDEKMNTVHRLMSSLVGTIAANSLKKAYLSHNLLTHKEVPLWVLVNILTMGATSMFYSCLKQQERQKISQSFKVKESDLAIYIKILSLFRNICAHEERCYNVKSKDWIVDTSHHSRLNLPKNASNDYIKGKQDIFALLIILKELLSKKDFKILIKKLDEAILELDTKLQTISINDVLDKMGFPANWKNL
ncbi:MAG: Abi family protein, partial [Cetobacterium sp.]